MIVRTRGDQLLLVPQHRHAHAAALLAGALTAVREPRKRFEMAVRIHDNGWQEYDAAPRLDKARGVPFDYTSTPPDDYRRIWERGIERALESDPYVGLLVSLHGMRFFKDKPARADVLFHEQERERENAVLEELQHEGTWDDLPEPVASHHELLGWLDGLSLFLCDGWDGPWKQTVLGTTYTVAWDGGPDDGEATVDPWPFAGPVDVRARGILLDGTRFADEVALREAMAAAGATTLSWRVRPR